MSIGRNSNRNQLRVGREARGLRGSECEWRLPSGEDLISFALGAGVAAGMLLPMAPVLGGADASLAGTSARREVRTRV